jgi:hypothetical protein
VPNPEAKLQRDIRLALGQHPTARLYRNEVGVSQVHKQCHHCGGRLTRPDAVVRYGLGVGSPDLVGWRTVTVTQEMVGTQVAQFVGLEIKTASGRLSKEQGFWQDRIRDAGGLAAVVRSVDDATQAIGGDDDDFLMIRRPPRSTLCPPRMAGFSAPRAGPGRRL